MVVQTILFDDIQVWEGRCAPENEPFSQTVVKPIPEWNSKLRDTAPSVLSANAVFDKTAPGGGCPKLEVQNIGARDCDQYQVQLNIRPSWGSLDSRDGKWTVHGVDVIDYNADAGAPSQPTSKGHVCCACSASLPSAIKLLQLTTLSVILLSYDKGIHSR